MKSNKKETLNFEEYQQKMQNQSLRKAEYNSINANKKITSSGSSKSLTKMPKATKIGSDSEQLGKEQLGKVEK